jgi:hypothetical protein
VQVVRYQIEGNYTWRVGVETALSPNADGAPMEVVWSLEVLCGIVGHVDTFVAGATESVLKVNESLGGRLLGPRPKGCCQCDGSHLAIEPETADFPLLAG